MTNTTRSLHLENQKFGKLTVIKTAPSILGGKKKKRFWGAWECRCDCGKSIIVKTTHLRKGQVKSCGCFVAAILSNGKLLKPGQKINHLTTVEYKKESQWLCSCICGNTITTSTHSIISGNIKSCGCLTIKIKQIISKEKLEKLNAGRRQYEPRIASARRVWKRYCYADKQCDISFENFFKISQQICFYCGAEPSNSYNNFAIIANRGSVSAMLNGEFVYNGMDRIDSSLPHIINNVVTSCYKCNKYKSNMPQYEFLNNTIRLEIKEFIPIKINKIELPNINSLKTSIKCLYKNYNDGGLTIEEFYQISQMNCFYCNDPPRNNFNRAKSDKKSSIKAKQSGSFVYNGLDRIDSNLLHSIDNVVACCKRCNWGKGKLNLEEFQTWMKRIKTYQENKKEPKISPALD